VDVSTGAQTVVSSGGVFSTPWGIKWSLLGQLYVADADAFGLLGAVIQIDPFTGAQLPISSANSFVNPNGITTGGDRPVPTQNTTLGRIKGLYR